MYLADDDAAGDDQVAVRAVNAVKTGSSSRGGDIKPNGGDTWKYSRASDNPIPSSLDRHERHRELERERGGELESRHARIPVSSRNGARNYFRPGVAARDGGESRKRRMGRRVEVEDECRYESRKSPALSQPGPEGKGVVPRRGNEISEYVTGVNPRALGRGSSCRTLLGLSVCLSACLPVCLLSSVCVCVPCFVCLCVYASVAPRCVCARMCGGERNARNAL